MNERIEELAEEANEYANSRLEGPSPIWFACFNEKFAKLIVRECGKSCTLQGDEDDMFSKFGIKHFGVEE